MKKTIIIAEAGVNHNGDIDIAKKLIDAAAEAKVDYVKFQTFTAEKIVSKSAKKAEYQVKENNKFTDLTQFKMLKKLELSEKNHYELIDYCNSKNIKFCSTAFDLNGLDFLHKLNLDFFKIPSGEITNYPYLKKISSLAKRVILSTGMSEIFEIEQAIKILISGKLEKNNITVLHCNTEYPTPMVDVNLKAMESIKNSLKIDVGYSDHTLGIEVPIAAVALGAKVIEKHFTIDRTMEGPDHQASLEPHELKDMVKSIRNIEIVMQGEGIKNVSKSEKKNLVNVRKSIHLIKDILKDEIIKEHHLTTLRPNKGISPMRWNEVLGKKAKKKLYKGNYLSWQDII